MSQAIFEQLCTHVKQTALLESANELLAWDERTKLPAEAGHFRADQMTYISGLIHQRQTDPQLGDWLGQLADDKLAADPHSDTGTTIRQLKRSYEKLVKVPQKLVEEMTRAAILGQQAWVEARKADDFKAFEPHVRKMVELKREQAEAVGYAEVRYDALLDDYEPNATTREVSEVLAALRTELVPLTAEIAASSRKPQTQVLTKRYPVDQQEAFGTEMAAAMGFDFSRGRLDVTSHPFCTSLGPNDCRITTRYDEKFFPSAFFGILHEAGHGMYDQGLRKEQFGLPPGTYVSLGIHESQSRMWENCVGRSRAFWEFAFPKLQQQFPEAVSDVDLDTFWCAVNEVKPSLIRVEADEATYNLHIIIRFELEQALINDDLSPADLPQAWNEKYQNYLGIVSPSDADGVLQDIHWSAGLIGYFPTYSLGNLYAAQLFQQAEKEIGPLADQFRAGEFSPLLQWLVEKVHHAGQCYSSAEIVERATGQGISSAPLISYMREKYEQVYGLS